MMGLGTMREINRRAAIRQAGRQKRPYRLADDDLGHFGKFHRLPTLPFLGYWMPEGFEMTRVFLVDSSGAGRPGEPPYTFKEFLGKIVPGRYYAVVEAGQLQVHIAEFVGEGDWPCEEVDLSGRATFSPSRLAEIANYRHQS